MAAKKIYVDLNLQQNHLVKAAVENLSSAPGTPVAGQMYFDTVKNQFGVYNGTIWVYQGDLSLIEWQDSVITEIAYIKTTTGAPTTTGATTGEYLLDTVDNKIYLSTSGDTWNAGTTLTNGQRYIFKKNGSGSGTGITSVGDNKIYYSNGTTVGSITPTTGMFVSVDNEPTYLYYFGGSFWAPKAFENNTASNGITLSGVDIQLDLTSLTAAASIISAAGTDYFVFIDSSDSNNEKKQSLFDFVTTITGTGLVQDGTTGKIKIDAASAAEAIAGASTSKVVTPLSIASFIHTYNNSFIVGDWVGAGPYTLTYPLATTAVTTPKHVTVKDSTGDEVTVNVNVTGSIVVLTSNSTFAGSVEISGKQ